MILSKLLEQIIEENLMCSPMEKQTVVAHTGESLLWMELWYVSYEKKVLVAEFLRKFSRRQAS